jgi:acetyltransferase-like isoleucine patch superfamily enzyme
MKEIIREAWNAPWKAWNGIWRWFIYPRVRLLFAINGIQWNPGWTFYGMPIIQKHRLSQIIFGPRLSLRSSVRSNALAPNHPVIIATSEEGARLEVGCDFHMTGGTLCSAERIIIGSNVTVGANSIIVDTDFHPLDIRQRRILPRGGHTRPVTINDDVFIGMNCIILKGVTIGHGSVIGAGSVVSKDVSDHVIVGGNPAITIRELPNKIDTDITNDYPNPYPFGH